MEALQTPAECFEDLTAFPYAQKFLGCGEDGGEPRMAYVAEGPHEHYPILLVHGGPTWAYLWRRVMPSLIEGGYRVYAPDLIGFGRSSKPARGEDVGLDNQLEWLSRFVEHHDIHDATLVGHGLSTYLALRLLNSHPGRFDSFVGISPVFETNPAVEDMFEQVAQVEEVYVSEVVEAGLAQEISALVGDGYDAPFDDASRCAALANLARFLPPEDWAEKLGPVSVPLLDVRGSDDHLTTGDWASRLELREPPMTRVVPGAGHYLPEERGAEVALVILELFARLWR